MPPAPREPPPRVAIPSRDAAVLVVEDNDEFLTDYRVAGGMTGYVARAQSLAALLRAHGVNAEVLSVGEGVTTLDHLAAYRVLYLPDANTIYEALRQALEAYVRAGGVLVGIGEVGRYPGEWATPWPFGALFGLETRPVDPWRTGVSREEHGLYRFAEVVGEDPIVADFGNRVDFGEDARFVWATVPAGARVVAEYPRHVVRSSEDAPPRVVDHPIPALTLRPVGLGTAIYLAVLPGDRKPDGWQKAGDAGRLLARATYYAPRELRLPAHPWNIVTSWNQVGYDADWPKLAILRIAGRADPVAGSFRLTGADNAVVREGKMEPWPHPLWNSAFLVADFSELRNPGIYHLHLHLPTLDFSTSVAVRIGERVAEQELLPTQWDFLRAMRCGERCHRRDPVVGGYHDATGDWAVRMWSMPHLVWALARYLEEKPASEPAAEELRWALSWCLRMQAPDGAAYASIRPPGDHSGGGSPIHVRPWEDTTVRERETRYSHEYTATYAAALARAATALRGRDPDLAARSLEAARRAFERQAQDPLERTADLGNAVWAALELCRASADAAPLGRARPWIAAILKRQLPPGRVAEADIYGDFFADEACTTFNPQQWKVFHAMGIYLGLVEAARALDPADPLRANVRAALKNFAQGYLLPMASLTPYRQLACGLEPMGDGTFTVYFFSHRGAWVRHHGLNCDMLARATIGLELAREAEREGDAELARRLRALAAQQVNWLLGLNPLGYCMVTGLGACPAPLVDPGLGTGHLRGGIPNGIIGVGARNLPAWGVSWSSREYWLPHNAYLVSTLALLENAP